ncbi:3-deoxy-D-manno-octulosonate 8-phosphate phosphatase, YrbI family [Pseudomonas chlororaphis subsp. aurantiaca]|nr:3-deoxy-D-manno-octulosonate 8-phosphate phosphatase, YrbI family [Pseudomonas chlororaphis subsp. aurantiaca]
MGVLRFQRFGGARAIVLRIVARINGLASHKHLRIGPGGIALSLFDSAAGRGCEAMDEWLWHLPYGSPAERPGLAGVFSLRARRCELASAPALYVRAHEDLPMPVVPSPFMIAAPLAGPAHARGSLAARDPRQA